MFVLIDMITMGHSNNEKNNDGDTRVEMELRKDFNRMNTFCEVKKVNKLRDKNTNMQNS